MSIRKVSIIFCAALSFATAAISAKTVQPLKWLDPAVEMNEDAGMVSVSVSFDLKNMALGRNQELIVTPAIFSNNGSDSVMMRSVTVCGRNRWYWYLREGLAENPEKGIYRSGRDQVVAISESVQLQEWMKHSTVELIVKEASCCSAPKKVPGSSPNGNSLLASINADRPAFEFEYVFAPQLSDAPVEMALEGSAFVNFVVNRIELNPDYMINRQEINKILTSIDKVKNDNDAVITDIHIKGFASPEGSYANNTRLAQGRTATLANYVKDLYKFAPGIVSTSYEPEDWAGLRNYVADSLDYSIANRQGILDIIDSPLGYDAKDQAIKERFPKDYQVILKEIYPWLRHSDYKVAYTIKVYTDINDLKRLYASEPMKLRPVDFYTLATQYPEGSREYLDVMKKASEVYPDDPMINLNLANICMIDGNLEAAQSALLKAGHSPQADFARGVLAAKRGDLDGAESYFKLAKNEGVSQADFYLKQIGKQREYKPVTIEINN